MKVLVTTSSFGKGDPAPLDTLLKHGVTPVLNPHGRKLTEDEVLGLISKENPVGMIAGVEPLTARVLGEAEGLKVVSRCGIGLDSVDLQAAGRLGIKVFNTPDAPSDAVAELTMALMLCVLRRVGQADREIRAGAWKPVMGRLLAAQTVGIIGCGRIGCKVGRLCGAFGARVLGYDPAVDDAPGMEMAGLGKLLASADIITLHLPYSKDTHHFMDENKLAAMKDGAVLLNASRGGLVDEDALYAQLVSGHLSGAAMDTYEREPYEGPLKGLPQVLMTAHMGSYALESRARMEQEASDNLVMGLIEAGVLER